MCHMTYCSASGRLSAVVCQSRECSQVGACTQGLYTGVAACIYNVVLLAGRGDIWAAGMGR